MDADDLFEGRLRAALAELRPEGGAPARLQARVEAVPEGNARPALAVRLLRLPTRSLAGAAIATAAAMVLLLLAFQPRFSLPDGTGGPTPAAFDPTLEGPGLLYGVTPTLTIVPWLIAAATAALAIGAFLRHRGNLGRWSYFGIGGGLLLSAAAFAFSLHPGFDQGAFTSWGGVLGLVDAKPTEAGPLDAFYEIAKPGEPFMFGITIHNPGPLSIRLDGIVEDVDAATRIAPRWTALWLGSDPNAFLNPLDQLRLFSPEDVGPDGYLNVYVVGKASACAVGPNFDPAEQAFVIRGPAIRFGYSVLGLSSSGELDLLFQIEEPIKTGCEG
jgi:hypothetical protein